MQYTTRASEIDVHGVVTGVRTLAHPADRSAHGRPELEVEITQGAIFDAADPDSRAALERLIGALTAAVAEGRGLEVSHRLCVGGLTAEEAAELAASKAP